MFAEWLRAGGDYVISRSLRFDLQASAYMARTWPGAGDVARWTFSAWVKRSAVSAQHTIFAAIEQQKTAGNNFEGRQTHIAFDTSNRIDFWHEYDTTPGSAGGVNTYRKTVGAAISDKSAWFHLVCAWDTANPTAADRMRVYINGSRILNFSASADPPLNYALGTVNRAGQHTIGSRLDVTPVYSDMILAEVNFVDGLGLTADSFGEVDPLTAQWRPRKYSGAYGARGFYLPFTDGSTTAALGNDASGNGNTFTLTGFSVAGFENDSFYDSPTRALSPPNNVGNCCVWNSFDATTQAAAVVNGALLVGAGSGSWTVNSWGSIRATMGFRSGKWYWELSSPNIGAIANHEMHGVYSFESILPAFGASGYVGTSGAAWAIQGDGTKWNNNVGTAYGTALANNDVCMVAVDMDTQSIWFGKNGAWFGGGNPATNTAPAFTGVSGYLTPVISMVRTASGGPVFYANFGQQPFVHAAPSGFKALNTFNMGAPIVALPRNQFDAYAYVGDAANPRALNGLSFQPDLVWIKNRSSAISHLIHDSQRGGGRTLVSDSPNSEIINHVNGSVTAFTANGFTLSGATDTTLINAAAAQYIAWCARRSASCGFDVVLYTGTGANRTVAHSLGVAPRMMIIHQRNDGTPRNWNVYHYQLTGGNQRKLYLNTTASEMVDATVWNNTTPTASVFTVGTQAEVNAAGINYVAYLFADVPGMCKVGTYNGNGVDPGPFIFTGFRPRFILFKACIPSGGSGQMMDRGRDNIGIWVRSLAAESNAAEASTQAREIWANGMFIRNAVDNVAGQTYAFVAFAEAPFHYALATT